MRWSPSGSVAERAGEQVERQAVAGERERRVVAGALVAHEGVGAVELVPGEGEAGLGEPLVDQEPALDRDVRVLAPPDHQEFAPDLAGALERVVAALAEAPCVEVGGVEAGGGADLRV